MPLKRELGLPDLTLFVTHAGPGSILLWLLAAIFFLIPLAVTVACYRQASRSRRTLSMDASRLRLGAFAKIHPRWNTPYVSINTFGILASVLLVALQFGDTLRAANQALERHVRDRQTRPAQGSRQPLS